MMMSDLPTIVYGVNNCQHPNMQQSPIFPSSKQPFHHQSSLSIINTAFHHLQSQQRTRTDTVLCKSYQCHSCTSCIRMWKWNSNITMEFYLTCPIAHPIYLSFLPALHQCPTVHFYLSPINNIPPTPSTRSFLPAIYLPTAIHLDDTVHL